MGGWDFWTDNPASMNGKERRKYNLLYGPDMAPGLHVSRTDYPLQTLCTFMPANNRLQMACATSPTSSTTKPVRDPKCPYSAVE